MCARARARRNCSSDRCKAAFALSAAARIVASARKLSSPRNLSRPQLFPYHPVFRSRRNIYGSLQRVARAHTLRTLARARAISRIKGENSFKDLCVSCDLIDRFNEFQRFGNARSRVLAGNINCTYNYPVYSVDHLSINLLLNYT